MSAGSCFASNVRRYLEAAGLTYTSAELPHPAWPEDVEAPYYEAFSARYGNVYTARQMRQLIERAVGSFTPREDHWLVDGSYVDPFRPGLQNRASSLAEHRAVTRQHLDAVRSALSTSTVLIFTLGLTEAWISADDGAVFPVCPGTVAGVFDPERHRFHNFTADEVTVDLVRMIELARAVNPRLKVILTVSPVPLVATATDQHVLVATTYSKSVLRVAADHASRLVQDVSYFPAYELVTGPQAAGTAFEPDLRTVREEVIAMVMSAFFDAYFDEPAGAPSVEEPERVSAVAPPHAKEPSVSDVDDLRLALVASMRADCEEMSLDEELARSPD
jgi:hypothetical protein